MNKIKITIAFARSVSNFQVKKKKKQTDTVSTFRGSLQLSDQQEG